MNKWFGQLKYIKKLESRVKSLASAEYARDESVCVLFDMILDDRLSLAEIPQIVRVESFGRLYVAAIRIARDMKNCERYIEALSLLCDDIEAASPKSREILISILNDYVDLSPFKEDKRFEAFRLSVKKDLLQDLFNY
jgi:hypothetical protein